MKEYFQLMFENQRLFKFSSKAQIIKLLLGDIMVGVLATVGFLPLFFLVLTMVSPASLKSYAVMASLLDYFSLTETNDILLMFSILVALFFIFKSILQIIYFRKMSAISQKWSNHISQEIFLNYFQADYSILLKKSITQMRTMISYGHSVPKEFFMNFIMTISYIVQTLFLLVVVVVVLKFFVFFMLLIGLIIFLFNKFYIKEKLQKIQERLLKRTIQKSFIEERSINNIKEAKLSGKEDIFIKKYNEIISGNTNDGARSSFLNYSPSEITEILTIIAIIFIFNSLIFVSQDSAVLTAQIGVIVAVTIRLVPSFNRITSHLNQVKAFSTVLKRLINEYKEVLSYRSIATEHSVPIDFKKNIHINHLSYHYPQHDDDAIKKLDMIIKKGQFIGLTGPSGSGKTTLINLLIGFIMPSKGTIKIDDTILERKHVRAWHQKIGLVDQNIYIASATVAENVVYGEELSIIKNSKEKQKRIIAALKKSQIWDFVKTLPQGIFTKIGEGAKLLSGGQAQRIAIARAFYRDIELLILDEASAKLDMITEKTFFDYLEQLKGKITVVMIAHRLSTLKCCDNIIFMKDGKIKNSGNFKELEKKDKEFRIYLEQARI
ncbi:MAG: ATP-binding cassette domain-containing protein [Alphaproteobacteria bacterium]